MGERVGAERAEQVSEDSGDGALVEQAAPGRTTFTDAGALPPVGGDSVVARASASELAFGSHGDGPYGHHHEHDLDDREGGEGGLIDDSSQRFARDPVLAQVRAGGKTLVVGDKGSAVNKVQSALRDLGFAVDVHGVYTDGTAEIVKAFQKRHKLAETGKVDSTTLDALKSDFSTRKPYADAAKQEAPGLHAQPGKEWDAAHPPTSLMRNVRNLGKAEQQEALDAMSPAAPGPKGTFKKDIGGVSYKSRLEALLEPKIIDQWNRLAKGRAQKHKDKDNLHSLKTAEHVGEQSKAATDKVFGSYRVGPKLEAGVQLLDKFDTEDKAIKAMSDPEQKKTARWRVEKIVRTDADVDKLNHEHDVDRDRAEEKQAILEVTTALAAKHLDKLLDIQRAWPASADPEAGTIHLQLFKGPNAEANRKILWRMFNTLVHEYIHTLEHSAWRTWRDDTISKQDPAKGHTLREGVTELFTRVVLSTVNQNDKNMRKAVEGAYYDSDESPPDIQRSGYDGEAGRAEQLAGVTSIHNLYAAYFLGQTRLVGG